VKSHLFDLNRNDPRFDNVAKKLKDWSAHFLGDGPARSDDTGRILPPQPARPIPKNASPARDAHGFDLNSSLERFGQGLLKTARTAGAIGSTVKDLQTGLNLTNRAAAGRWGPDTVLKEDGVMGPKTRSAVLGALAGKGTAQARGALALGRFHNYARDDNRRDYSDLAKTTESTFGSKLLGSQKPPAEKAPRRESLALQDTLNDLGKDRYGADNWPPLKRDGWIGPKTIDVFSRKAKVFDPEKLTRTFGGYLGFL